MKRSRWDRSVTSELERKWFMEEGTTKNFLLLCNAHGRGGVGPMGIFGALPKTGSVWTEKGDARSDLSRKRENLGSTTLQRKGGGDEKKEEKKGHSNCVSLSYFGDAQGGKTDIGADDPN